jgi:glycosyltransferase involved in cell wall biosynthesis
MSTYESYVDRLIHRPQRQWDSDPLIVYNETFSDKTPTFSLVMPIHNQAGIVKNILTSLVINTLGSYEMILILDGCRDSTRQEVLDWIRETSRPANLYKIYVHENPTGIFETSCDNQGFVISRGEFIVEIQADMQMLTMGYNLALAVPMVLFEDLIAVSGRCCHGLNVKTPSHNVGKVGMKTDTPHGLPSFDWFNRVVLSHTVNRGPLALRRSMVEQLGYLDEEHYVLGNDEHDLFSRAWVGRQWRTGFVPVEVYSPQHWGSTRKGMPADTRAYLTRRESKERGGFMSNNRDHILYPSADVRQIPIDRQLYAVQILMKEQ